VVAPTFGSGFAGLPSFPQGYGMGGCIGSGGYGSPYYGSDLGPITSAATPATNMMPMLPAITLPATDATERRESEKFAAQEYTVASAKPTTATAARLTIELPADAVLYVDGEKVNGTGPTRNFHTPQLPAGTFFYVLKAVVKVNDKPITETVRVVVKAGDAKTQSFGKLLAAVQGARSPALASSDK